MNLIQLLCISLCVAVAQTGAIWDSVARAWVTTGESRGLPTTPGNCLPKQPSEYAKSTIMFERQYQLRQGPGTLMKTYTTMMDCFNACYSNSSCGTMWFAGYNRSCTHYPTTMTCALVSDPRDYTILNPLVTIRQQLSGTAIRNTINTTAASGRLALCVAWRPAMKCKLQPFMMGSGYLEAAANKNPTFFLSTEKTSECGSFMDIYRKSAGNGDYYYSNNRSTSDWTPVPGFYSWDPMLC
ncbi:unnamed protein product, partial [Mesorhabditis spiculigera]